MRAWVMAETRSSNLTRVGNCVLLLRLGIALLGGLSWSFDSRSGATSTFSEALRLLGAPCQCKQASLAGGRRRLLRTAGEFDGGSLAHLSVGSV